LVSYYAFYPKSLPFFIVDLTHCYLNSRCTQISTFTKPRMSMALDLM
jgi:hypothetical protein